MAKLINPIRLVNFEIDQTQHFGIFYNHQLIALSSLGVEFAQDIRQILSFDKEQLHDLKSRLSKVKEFVDTSKISYLPPITDAKIICVGLNYKDHAKETSKELPLNPILFARFNSAVVGHEQESIITDHSKKYDYEGELAVIIGKCATNVNEGEAHKYIAGYSIFNDVTVRDYQAKSSQWLLGKNFDHSGSFGPFITLAAGINADNLKIITRLNGEIMQNGNTKDMIFSVNKLIAVITEAITLKSGDVIVTGTPAGVGYTRNPPVYLRDADICEIEIEKVGILRNKVYAKKSH
jgi:acylpyruvate hydrolase